MVDPPQPAREVDVEPGAVQIPDHPVELNRGQRRGRDEDAVGTAALRRRLGVGEIAEPAYLGRGRRGVEGWTDHAAGPESEFRVLLQEVIKAERLLVRAHHDHRTAVPTFASPGGEPGPVGVAGDPQRDEAEDRSSHHLVDRDTHLNVGAKRPQQKSGQKTGASEAARLDCADVTYPRQVEALRGDRGQGGEGKGDRQSKHRPEPTPAREPVGQGEGGGPGDERRAGIGEQQDPSQRARSPSGYGRRR